MTERIAAVHREVVKLEPKRLALALDPRFATFKTYGPPMSHLYDHINWCGASIPAQIEFVWGVIPRPSKGIKGINSHPIPWGGDVLIVGWPMTEPMV